MTKKTLQHCWGFFSPQSFFKRNKFGSCLENVIPPLDFFKEKEYPKGKRKKAWKLQTFSVFSLCEKALCYWRARSPPGSVAKKQRWRFFSSSPPLHTSKKLNSFFSLLSNLDFPGRFTHFSAAFKKQSFSFFFRVLRCWVSEFLLACLLGRFFSSFLKRDPPFCSVVVLHRSKKNNCPFFGRGEGVLWTFVGFFVLF